MIFFFEIPFFLIFFLICAFLGINLVALKPLVIIIAIIGIIFSILGIVDSVNSMDSNEFGNSVIVLILNIALLIFFIALKSDKPVYLFDILSYILF